MIAIARAHDRDNPGATVADVSEWSLSQAIQAAALLEMSIGRIPAEAWSGTLTERLHWAAVSQPAAIIEPHCDNLPERPDARGAYALVHADNAPAIDLARLIVAELAPIVPALHHGGLWFYKHGDRWAARGNEPASYKGKPLALLEQQHTAGIIVECGFLSNIEDRTWLMDTANRAAIGRAIGRACVSWYISRR